ncbi:hypothetical protein GDO86_016135 [Hymenochirus boettgeri]|uniref:Uncharacterized protein n=1 Tax=Hymenochirus boettgeri TaxID=247094 RepID=A0A8T2JZ75_9PIPI|nr:hypothetical protein GDO86_016135 [Hymenochirus boettgeri]
MHALIHGTWTIATYYLLVFLLHTSLPFSLYYTVLHVLFCSLINSISNLLCNGQLPGSPLNSTLYTKSFS